MGATGVLSSCVTALMKESCCSLRRISRTRKIVFSTTPAMISRKKMTPRIARTPRRQFRTIQLTFSVTARTTMQMPRTVKKMTDRRRPLIMRQRLLRSLRGFLDWKRPQLGDFQIPHDADRAKHLERDPADVELVPFEAVTRRHGVRVVV